MAATTKVHSITVSPKAASGPGALDGHEARCTCGFVAGTSLGEREARTQGWAHVEWARKAGR
jgi:hypothetical protein